MKSDKKEKNKSNNTKDELDTETTFVNMNVEGFRWYKPNKSEQEDQQIPNMTSSERRAMIRGAWHALLPVIIGMLLVFGMLVGFAYLWLH